MLVRGFCAPEESTACQYFDVNTLRTEQRTQSCLLRLLIFRNYDIINGYCFKPVNLCLFVTQQYKLTQYYPNNLISIIDFLPFFPPNFTAYLQFQRWWSYFSKPIMVISFIQAENNSITHPGPIITLAFVIGQRWAYDLS